MASATYFSRLNTGITTETKRHKFSLFPAIPVPRGVSIASICTSLSPRIGARNDVFANGRTSARAEASFLPDGGSSLQPAQVKSSELYQFFRLLSRTQSVELISRFGRLYVLRQPSLPPKRHAVLKRSKVVLWRLIPKVTMEYAMVFPTSMSLVLAQLWVLGMTQ